VVTEEIISLSITRIGDVITMRDNKLRAFCTKSSVACLANPTATGSVVILPPLNTAPPTVIITAPPTLGLCANLMLDATGSYGHVGRLYASAVWTVSAFTGEAFRTTLSTTDLANYLNLLSSSSQVQQPFIILRNQLVAATYTFTLRLENFFGLSSSSTVSVIVSSNSTVPHLTVIGPKYRTIYASSSLSILSTGALSNCTAAAPVTYKWTVELDGVPVSITSVSSDPLVFSALPYTLTVDKTYEVIVTASTGKSSASASVLVYVSRGAVTAAVVGGYSRSLPATEALTLNALISKDMDVPASQVSTLLFLVCSVAV
jgi:REJ domain